MRRPSKFRIHEVFEHHPVFDYRPPAYLTAGKWAIAAVAVTTLLAALYVGLWYYAAGQLRDAALVWIEARRQEGASVRFERLDIGGFPLHLRLAVAKPAIAYPKAATPWGWEADALTGTLRPWNFSRIALDAPGGHALTWTADGIRHAVRGTIRTLAATLSLTGGRVTAVRAELAGADLKGDAPGLGLAIGRGTVGASWQPAAGATERTPIAELHLALQDIGLPATWALPLGPAVAAADLDASLLGKLGAAPLQEALAQWRDDGGTVEVRRLGLTYGPLSLTADGTLALDADMQPIGAFTTRAEGFFEAIDALRTQGVIRSRDAVTAKLVLGALAKRGEGGRASLTVPLTIQDRRLFAGPVPLIDLPPISWEGAGPKR